MDSHCPAGGHAPTETPKAILLFAQPKFPLGQIVATPNALNRLAQADIQAGLTRHAAGDWGDLCADDRRENERALREGLQLLSAYNAGNGVRFWIITEADKSVTTVLLPEDY